jgi:hypothetical protein
MSTAALANLPEEFLLNIPSTRKAPWSHFVLVRKTIGLDGKTRLTLSPDTTILVPSVELPPHYHKGSTIYAKDGALARLPLVGADNATLHLATFKICTSVTVQIHTNATTPKTIPILYTSKHRALLGSWLNANINAVPIPPPPPSSSTVIAAPTTTSSPAVAPEPITIPSPTAALIASPPAALSTIEHVDPLTAAPAPKKKKSAVIPSSGSNMLAPFVAKQLLALARIRHDMCPIVAEEFSEGNTAAMPCGHLFAQIAIEESFKKMPRICPACRAQGLPTYV